MFDCTSGTPTQKKRPLSSENDRRKVCLYVYSDFRLDIEALPKLIFIFSMIS